MLDEEEVSPQRIMAAGGDRGLARNLRALEAACHAIAFQAGGVVHRAAGAAA